MGWLGWYIHPSGIGAHILQVTINLLRAQHEDIARAVGDLMALFDLRYVEAAPLLGPARTRIAQVITKHLKSEDELLLTRCASGG